MLPLAAQLISQPASGASPAREALFEVHPLEPSADCDPRETVGDSKQELSSPVLPTFLAHRIWSKIGWLFQMVKFERSLLSINREQEHLEFS